MNKHIIKKKNIVVFTLLGIISLLLIINFKNNGIIQFNNQKKSLAKQVAQVEETYDKEAGRDAIVSSLSIIERKTGVDAFDKDDKPGNDSSADNNIIRTLDMLSYTIEVGMNLKDEANENIRVATIKVEATLPQECKNKVRWDLDSMLWADEGSFVSEDGLTFNGYYTMGENQISIPGTQNLLLVAKILYAENGFEFSPDFSISLLGNDSNEVQTLEDKENVKVSATDKYDIALSCRSSNQTILVGEQEGKLFGYAFAFILKGDNPQKGLRGIERPINDISFDIKYNLNRQDNVTKENTDITSNNARFYNYKYNVSSAQALGDPKNSLEDIPYMDWLSWNWCPLSKLSDWEKEDHIYQRKAVYQNGELKMVDKGNGTVNVTISKWDISETFPDLHDMSTSNETNHHSFTEDYGYVSTGMFYIMVDVNNETTMGNTTVSLNVSIENVNVEKLDKEKFSQEVDLNNNKNHQQFINGIEGIYSKNIQYMWDSMYPVESSWDVGDGSAFANWDIFVSNGIIIGGENAVKDWVYGLDCLVKFDDKALQLRKTSDGREYTVSDLRSGKEISGFEYNVLYAVKKDGTGWKSDDEMEETSMDDLKYYDTIEELEPGETCIAVLIESQKGILKSGKNININIPFKIRRDATINSVAQVLNDVRIYNKENIPDRSTETHLLDTNKSIYEPIKWNKEKEEYIKAEYDDGGNIEKGTHNPGHIVGDSLRIIAGDLRVNIEPFQNDVRKDVYNMGNGENEVDYKLHIVLEKANSIDQEIEGVKVKATAILPKGLTYKKGSSNKDEPEIINNEDGTTTLIWYEEDCSSNVNIEDITFTAYISETTGNNTVYEISAVVMEEPDEDGIYKVGDSTTGSRMSDNESITVVNLSSYAFTKRRDEPSIECNGKLHYILTFYNNSSTEAVDFELLDVLPYNGDNRGSNFNGTYTLDHIDIKGNEGQEDLKVYITEDESLRNGGINASTDNLQGLVKWQNVQMRSINTQSTAILISGQLSEKALVTIDIYLQTKENDPLDIYANNATVMTETLQVPLESTNEEIVVVDRAIEGMVWFDQNENGLKDIWEPYLENIALSLETEEGAEVTDVFEKNVEEVKTDSSGNYRFMNLPNGKYKVKITIDDNIFEITEKEVGGRTKINSKFDPNTKETDVIDLSEENDTVVLERYVNAGLKSDTYEQIIGNIQANKTASPENNSEVIKDSEITYKINIKNTGLESKTFSVKDKIPEGTRFQEQSIKVKGEPEIEKTEQDLTEKGIEMTLEGQETATIEFTVIVTGEGLLNEENIITNSAEVDGKTTNEVKHKYYRRAEINSKKRAKIGDEEREYAKEGDTIKYEIEVTNDGNIDKIVNIKDTIPDGTEFVDKSIKINNESTEFTEEDLTEKGININVLPASEETARKLKIMKNPPTITKVEDEQSLERTTVFCSPKNDDGTVNPIYKSYDSVLETLDWRNSIIGYNSMPGTTDLWPLAWSVEFAVNCKEFYVNTCTSFRILVDEGRGYEITNYGGIEQTLEETGSIGDFSGVWHKITFDKKKERKIRVELTDNVFNGVRINSDDEIKAIERTSNQKVLYVGSSITRGGDFATYCSWPNITSNILNLECMNNGIIATGYASSSGSNHKYSERLVKLMEKLNPDIVVLAAGLNDSWKYGADQVVPEAEECINYIKEHSSAKIIMIGVYYPNMWVSDSAKGINNGLREKALENNLPFIDLINGDTYNEAGEKLTVGSGGYITGTGKMGDPKNDGNADKYVYEDGIHLSLEGNQYFGERLAEEFYKILNNIRVEKTSPVTLSFEVQVKPLGEGAYSKKITNTATVNGESTNPVDVDVRKTNIVATKTASPENNSEVKKDSKITYKINVINIGDKQEKFLVKDKIPEGTSFQAGSIKIKGKLEKEKTEKDLTETGIEVILNEKETATIEFTVIVTGEGLLNEKNIIVNCAEVGGQPTNEVKHRYYRKAKIDSEKKATIENEEREYAKEGDKIKYEIKVTNDGNIDKIVNIKDTIPDGTEFVDKSIKINDESTEFTKEDLTENGINIDVLPTSGETARKLKIMENPPTITKVEDEQSLTETKMCDPIIDGKVNPIYTSYDSELETLGWGTSIIGQNSLSSTKTIWPQLYSIEFVVNCSEFFVNTCTSFRILVDEGKGYEITNYDGIKQTLTDTGADFKGAWYKITFDEKKERKIKVELTDCVFNGVRIYNDDEIKAIERPSNQKVLYVGSSITRGGDLPAYYSWPNITSNILNLECMNNGVGGTGYLSDVDKTKAIYYDRLTTLINKLKPDIVVLEAGPNDCWQKYNADQVVPEAEKCINYIKENSSAQIIMIGVYYPNINVPEGAIEINDRLREKSLEKNLPFIDLLNGDTYNEAGEKVTVGSEGYITGTGNIDAPKNDGNADKYVLGDTVHLTIEGNQYFGEKLAKEFYKILNGAQVEETSPVTLSFEVQVKLLDEEVYSKTIENTATVDEVSTNTEQTEVKKPNIVATKKAEPEGGNVKKGQEITYTIELDNTTGTEDETVRVKDTLPTGVEYKDTTLSIVKDEIEETHEIEDLKTNGIEVTVPAGKKVDVKFKVKVTGEGLENNQKIENTAKVNENPTNSVTHTYLEEDKIVNIKVMKKWEDNNNQKGERPQSIKIQLYADEVLTREEVVTGITDSNQWEYTFTNLNKYDEEGNEIEYRIDEEELENSDYTKKSVTSPLKKTEDGYEGTIVNTIKEKEPERTGSLKITKMGRTKAEADTGRLGKPLAGVEFRIYRVENDSTDLTVPDKYANVKEAGYPTPEDDDKWYTESMVTGEDGTIKFENLPLGRYLVEEVSAPDYIVGKISNFIVDIPLTNEDSTLLYDVEIIPKNEVVYGDITLTKEGPNGEKLTGVTFKLQRKEEGEKWVDYPNSEECNTLTDREGTITVGALPTGTYRFVELGLGINEGYILDNKHGYEFTVSMDSATKQATVSPSEIKVVNDKPTVEKTVESYVRDSENNNTVKGNQDGNKSFDKGDIVTYKVEVDIPLAIADLNIFNISDTMDSNLSYEEGTVKVKAYKKSEDEVEATETEINLIESTDYTITLGGENGRTWLVELSTTGKKKLTGYYKLEITYKAIVLGTEKTEIGYNNNAKLEYSTKVDVDIDENPNKDEPKESQDGEIVYTGGFKIDKRENSAEGTKLDGAKFKIASSKEDAKNDIFIKDENGQEIEITSNEIGLAEYWGLSYGTYYLVEVQAPTGYNLLHDPVGITVGAESYKDENTVVVINRKGLELPETGGKGTLIFSIGGLILIIFGVLLYKKSKT